MEFSIGDPGSLILASPASDRLVLPDLGTPFSAILDDAMKDVKMYLRKRVFDALGDATYLG